MKWWQCLSLLLLLLGVVSGTHFRFGTIQWTSVSGSPLTIQFRVDAIFRRSWSSWNKVVPGQIFTPGTFTFGDGNSVNLNLNCTSINIPDDYAAGTAIITKTYPNVAKTYTAGHTSKGKILSLNNNADAIWNFTTTITIRPTSTEVYASPISSGLPIVPVSTGKVNSFQMPKSSPMANSDLYWVLGTSIDLGTNFKDTPQTQPPNFSITPGGLVTFDTRGINSGLWNTQLILHDRVSGNYIAIDFIINVSNNDIGQCSPDCARPGLTCSANSDCGACGGGGGCMFAAPMVSVAESQNIIKTFPVSPSNGGVVNWIVGRTQEFALVATDTNITNPVYIYVGNIPTGSTVSSQSSCSPNTNSCNCTNVAQPCNSPQRVTLSWNPELSSVGSYAVCFGVRQTVPISVELPYSQHCVTINVSPPQCGAGQVIANAPASCSSASTFDPAVCCNCPAGFDNSTACTSCLPGNFGSNCSPCPNCNEPQGTCNDGISGNGFCTCNNGFAGANCQVLVNSRCRSTQASTLLSSSGSGVVFSPSNVALYMSILSNNSGSVFTSFTAKAPTNPVIDVVLLQDISATTTADDLKSLANFISVFMTNLVSNYPGSLVGLATFDGVPGNYRKWSSLTGDSDSLRTYINSISINTNSATNYVSSLEATVAASADSFGWRDTSFKTVVVLTSKTYNPSGMSVSNFASSIAQNSVNPLFLYRGSGTNPYNSLVNTLRFGRSNTLASSQSNWYSQIATELRSNLLTQFTAVATSDTYGFFKYGDSKTIQSGSSSSLSIQFTFPSIDKNSFSVFPTVSVAPIGWQSSRVLFNWNRRPVSSSSTFTTIQDTPFDFSLLSSDPDNNILSVLFKTLPSNGAIYLTNGTAVVAGTSYDVSALSLRFNNTLYWSGTTSFIFQTGDGCDTSNDATVTFIVKPINYPPTGKPFTVTVPEKSNATISFSSQVDDIEDDSSTLSIFISDVSGISSGNLYDSNNRIVRSGSRLPTQNALFVPANIYWNGNVQFKYYVVDSNNSASATYTVNVVVTPVNDPPVLSTSNAVLSCKIGYACTTSFTITDPDVGDSETATVSEFSIRNSEKFVAIRESTEVPVANGNIFTGLPSVSTIILSFTSDQFASGDLGSIRVIATDREGLNSSSIVFTIQTTQNTAPYLVERTPAGTVQLLEGGNVNITILGTDDDSSAQGENVTLIVNSNPSNGILRDSLGNVVSGMVPLALLRVPLANHTAYTLTYTPTNYWFGKDSFSFILKDFVGGTSVSYNVPFDVTHVNHAPTSEDFKAIVTQNVDYTFTGFTGNDVDRDIPLYLVIKSLPTQGTLRFADGTDVEINTPISSVNPGWNLIYTPIRNRWGENFDTIKFLVNDGELESSEHTSTIDVIHVNQAPESFDGQYTTKQNTVLKIVLNATDVDDESNTLTGIITSLGYNAASFLGQLYDSDPSSPSAVELTENSIFRITDGIYYVPPVGGYSDPDGSIFTAFSFQARDPAGLLSSVSSASLIVDWVNPGPVYTGPSFVDVFENSQVDIFLSGYNVRYPTEIVRASITVNPERGLLYGFEDGPGTPVTYFNQTGSQSVNEDSIVRFQPVEYENGQNYANFTFTLTDRFQVTNAFTIIINVIPVNQAPVLYEGAPSASIYKNTDVQIEFTAWDRDSPLESLVAYVSRFPNNGRLYACNKQSDGSCSKGDSLNLGTDVVIPKVDTASWKLIYTPGRDYVGTETPSFVVKDDYNASSNPYRFGIRVKAVNIPPNVTVDGPFTTNIYQGVPLSNTTVADPDGGSSSELLQVIALTNGTLNTTNPLAFVPPLRRPNPECVLSDDKRNLTCVGSQQNLNLYLSGLVFTPSEAGEHRVFVYINDLGAGADVSDRATSHLSANATIIVNSVPLAAAAEPKRDLTLALILGSVGGGIGAAAAVGLVTRLIKKPDTNLFDNMLLFEEGGVTSNPLYEDNNTEINNPIFENE